MSAGQQVNSSQHQPRRISVENFDPHSKQLVNSPRTVKACRLQGIAPDELLFISKDEYSKMFAKEKLDDHNLQIRFDHLEKRRQERVRVVADERQKLIEKQKAGIDIDSVHGSFRAANKGTAAGVLSREANMIEKIKKNQRKEIEQLVQYELETQAMRQKNEEKTRQQLDKEQRRMQSVEQKRREADAKRQQYEEEKRRKLEEEERERRRLDEDNHLKEKLKEDDHKRLERERRSEARRKEEEQKKKQEEFRLATEKILEQQRQEVLVRKNEMQEKDEDRRKRMQDERRIKIEQQKAKQEEHKAKIEDTKVKNDRMAGEKFEKYEEKKKAAEEKKKIWEDRKDELHNKNVEKFKKKEELIEKAKNTNQALLMHRKEDYYKKQENNKEKLKMKSIEEKRELEQRHREEAELEKKREDARKANIENHKNRTMGLLKTAEEKENKIKMTKERKEQERLLQNNLEEMKKLDKLEQVRRNERRKEYERNQLNLKILDENEKIQQMKKDKENLLREKSSIKAHMSIQKEDMTKKLQLVKEGRMDPNQLLVEDVGPGAQAMPGGGSMRGRQVAATAQFARGGGSVRQTRGSDGSPRMNEVAFATDTVEGVNSAAPGNFPGAGKAEIKPRPIIKTTEKGRSSPRHRNKVDGFDVRAGETFDMAMIRLKDIQGREMLRVLEEESKEENNREGEYLLVTDPNERKRLAKIHAVHKGKAKEKINMMIKKHDDEVADLRSRFVK